MGSTIRAVAVSCAMIADSLVMSSALRPATFTCLPQRLRSSACSSATFIFFRSPAVSCSSVGTVPVARMTESASAEQKFAGQPSRRPHRAPLSHSVDSSQCGSASPRALVRSALAARMAKVAARFFSSTSSRLTVMSGIHTSASGCTFGSE